MEPSLGLNLLRMDTATMSPERDEKGHARSMLVVMLHHRHERAPMYIAHLG